MKLQKMGRSLFGVLAAFIMAAAMIMVMPVTSKAAGANEDVTAVSNSVVHVNLTYRYDGNSDPETIFGLGSGFLINEENLITCDHVINIDDEVLAAVKEAVPEAATKKDSEIKDRLGFSITVNRDVTVAVEKIVQESAAMDWAILKLSSPLATKTQVAIRMDDVVATENVYAVGFPSESAAFQDVSKYTSEDVTITDGKVSKVTTSNGVDYLQTSCKLTAGNSGCPMVDEEGNVVGICVGATGTGFQDDYYYAVVITQITDTMDMLSISYTKANEETATETTTPETSDDTETTPEVIETTPVVTETTAAPSKEEGGLNKTLLIIIIAAAVVVVAVVIIIIAVVASSKKKKNDAAKTVSRPVPPAAPAAPSAPSAPTAPAGFNPSPVRPAANFGETTVLGSAGETTVLNRNINGGMLISVKTGQKIDINTEEFTIGRERTKVNYCISNNTTIGRVHAKIVNRNGAAYLIDQRATNGTFLNGVKCSPMQEYPIKSGDKITLSDEEFTYQA